MAKILVLDDDRLTQKIIGRVFGNAGHETLAADSTQHAWEKLQEHVLVDMVVLDNQLDREWGWQFLRMLRSSPAYRGIPVIVYTAHTERSSVIKYVELGVQSLHVKPYQAEVLLAELTKALKSKWSAQVMESTEVICERLGLSLQDYGGLLAAANRTITEILAVARQRLTSPNDPMLSSALSSIGQQCRSVGILVIGDVLDKVRKSAEDQNLAEVQSGLESVESFLVMIRHRMLEVMKMGDSVARTPVWVAKPLDEKNEPVAPAASFDAAFVRKIISKPLWHYGPHLKRVMRQPLLSPEEIAEMTKRVGAGAPFSTVGEVLKMIETIPGMATGQVVAIAQETKGFASIYHFILERVTGTDHSMDSPAALAKVVEQQGLAKVATLLAVARVANDVPKAGVLSLRQLYAQSLAAALISFEIGRLLKVTNEFRLAAAALTHDIGSWLFGLGEPGVYSLALALAEDGRMSIEETETALFGRDHHDVGREYLAGTGQSDLVQASAFLHHSPFKVTDPESVITVTVTHLAHLLAQAAITDSVLESKKIHALLRDPAYPAWGLLTSRGIHLPFEAPELVDTLAAISNTSNWIAHQFLDRAG